MKTHKYQVILEFESQQPLTPIKKALIQCENVIDYLYSSNKLTPNDHYVYGSEKITYKKLGTGVLPDDYFGDEDDEECQCHETGRHSTDDCPLLQAFLNDRRNTK